MTRQRRRQLLVDRGPVNRADTRALGRPMSQQKGSQVETWSAVYKSCARLVNMSLTTLLPHAEADPMTLEKCLQVDETSLSALLDHHLLLHIATGPALDEVVTNSDGKNLRAWHCLVSETASHLLRSEIYRLDRVASATPLRR